MSEPFDLDAAEAEVVRAPFQFNWGGRSWALENAFKLDLNVIVGALDGNVVAIDRSLRMGLGPDQADQFFGRPAVVDDEGKVLEAAISPVKALTLDGAKILLTRWTDHSGLESGESSGSSGSSTSTAEPSKPTSPDSTGSGSTKRSTAAKRSGTRRANSST